MTEESPTVRLKHILAQHASARTTSKKKAPPNAEQLRKGEQNRQLQLINDDLEQSTKLKKHISFWVLAVVSVYLVFVAGIIISVMCLDRTLSDTVIITLLTTTTINILGLPIIIIRALFKGKS